MSYPSHPFVNENVPSVVTKAQKAIRHWLVRVVLASIFHHERGGVADLRLRPRLGIGHSFGTERAEARAEVHPATLGTCLPLVT